MKINFDSIETEVCVGESLLDIVKRLELDTDSLKDRPLAAKINGETFSLNYIPMRESGELRRPFQTGCREISLVRYSTPRGRRLYDRTMLFVFLLACRRTFPKAEVKIEFTIGNGVYVTIKKTPELSEQDCAAIREEYRNIVAEDHKIIHKRFPIEDAIAHFTQDGQHDKVRLLKWRQFTFFDAHCIDGDTSYIESLYGETAPSTGYASVCEIVFGNPGLMLLYPSEENPDVPAENIPLPRLRQALTDCNEWGGLMHCTTVADLNDLSEQGLIRELIRTNEALHEKHFAELADQVIARDAKIVLIAGPSSSGKTTSANRLCTQLRVHGKQPILISLDDYYVDRDKLVPDENGEYDLEHFNTIDVERFNQDLQAILDGKVVELPRFDFAQHKRMPGGKTVHLDSDSVFVIEGLHALNPQLIAGQIDRSKIFRIYVSALIALNIDHHNRIPTTNLRMLRRLVRDYMTRGASIERTLSMWQSVRRGEKRWIFPYQEDADVMINTSTVYELAFLKRHIFPLLLEVRENSPYYDEVRSLIGFLNYVCESDAEFEIPPTSIVREFIGGNTFYL